MLLYYFVRFSLKPQQLICHICLPLPTDEVACRINILNHQGSTYLFYFSIYHMNKTHMNRSIDGEKRPKRLAETLDVLSDMSIMMHH